ncbi:hypothetical protein AB0910_24645 [Streptomyces sp. NPDC047002]|uniref:hypothetical protein n=1 Tax=Streptomyces sp. NPDC047002 TaxID=3155475 RepID=UPI0034513168
MYHRSPSGPPVDGTATDAMDSAGPRVWAAMTVEVALSVMAAARTGQLAVCDEDGQCTVLVTLARLTSVRDSAGYTDRTRLGDIVRGAGMPGAPSSPAAARPVRTAPSSPPPVRHHALCHRPFPVRPDQERRAGVDEGRQARAGRR